jgi:hypothetical protein
MSIISDFRNDKGVWAKSLYIDGKVHHTRSGQTWWGIATRCKVGGLYQRKNPAYIGCEMSKNFRDFQYFANWHIAQVGYNIGSYQLDKDILSKKKLYSEDVCVLVPSQLNTFMLDGAAIRGPHPQGVSWHKRDNVFHARLSIDGRMEHLGTYSTSCAAHEAYKQAKESEAYRWYERLKAGEFVVDERVIERMRTWTLPKEKLE